MTQLLPDSTATSDVETALSANESTRSTATPALVAEQEVLFGPAAAILVPPATTHRHWPGTRLIAAIGHIHIRLPEPRPIYPRRQSNYFEDARLSRQMDHL